jgi:iron complex outermembrane recepter protein
MGYLMRLCVVITAVCLCVVGLSVADDVHASIRKQTNIPAEGLGPALQTLAKERNFQIVFVSEEVNALHTEGAVGEFTPEEALKQLLKGTGLTYRFFGESAISIIPVTSAPSGTSAVDTEPTSRSNENGNEKEGAKSSFFRLAQANQGVAQSSSAVGSDIQSTSRSSEKSPGLEEILVTAQKKTERLQDVPVPVTVLDTQLLTDTGQVLLRDYYDTVPGLSVVPNLLSVQLITIRGITAGGYNTPTVGITIDDVPFGDATGTAGNTIPDIDPGDLDRIEVLRGPQGTLYGTNSMGGLIKYVLKDPSMDGFTGRIETGTSSVYNGAEPGFNIRGSANIPVSDTFAIRVSAFRRQDPGYINNPGDCNGSPCAPSSGINEAQVYGGHLSALWRPTADLSLKLSALYQHTEGNGLSEAVQGVGLGDLQQNYVAGAGLYNNTTQTYSATLNYKLGSTELTSITAYNAPRTYDTFDFTPFYSSSAVSFGVKGAPAIEDVKPERVSQELRLSGPIGRSLEYLVGAFYTHETIKAFYAVNAADPATGIAAGNLLSDSYPGSYKEYAGFADLTYHFTDRFDIQIGARETHYNVASDVAVETGPLTGQTAATVTPAYGSAANAFTYLVTPRLKLSDDLMLYIRAASGYRPGGPNTSASIADGAPPQVLPDKTYNYELGVKGDFLDHSLSVDASLYYIDWKAMQLQLDTSSLFLAYGANGGGAKSKGVELSLTARPLTGLTLSAWGSYDDAVLTDSFPANSSVYGLAGDRLPNTAKLSGNLGFEQDFSLPAAMTGYVGGTLVYVGNRLGFFLSVPPPPARLEYPSYTKLDMRAGVKNGDWTINAYVNNATNKRGVLTTIDFFPNEFVYITPRTIGVSIAKTF